RDKLIHELGKGGHWVLRLLRPRQLIRRSGATHHRLRLAATISVVLWTLFRLLGLQVVSADCTAHNTILAGLDLLRLLIAVGVLDDSDSVLTWLRLQQNTKLLSLIGILDFQHSVNEVESSDPHPSDLRVHESCHCSLLCQSMGVGARRLETGMSP